MLKDQEHVDAINNAVEALNTACRAAARDGLKVCVDRDNFMSPDKGGKEGYPVYKLTEARRLTDYLKT